MIASQDSARATSLLRSIFPDEGIERSAGNPIVFPTAVEAPTEPPAEMDTAVGGVAAGADVVRVRLQGSRHVAWDPRMEAAAERASALLRSSEAVLGGSTVSADRKVNEAVVTGWAPELQSQVAGYLEAALIAKPSFLSRRRNERASRRRLLSYPLPPLPAPDMGDPGESKAPPRKQWPWIRAAMRAQGRDPAAPVQSFELYPKRWPEVLNWLEEADLAMSRMQTGEKVNPPSDIRLVQSDMPVWAQGVVWDTRNPEDCHPVERSGPGDMPPGPQISAERFQQAADLLKWPDTDIIEQIKGGLESRTGTSLETVLSFHHKGLQTAYKQAAPIVARDTEKQWVSSPYRTLPFVPCRLIPRNVVSQTKWKVTLDKDGRPVLDAETGLPEVKEVPKFRATSDESWGPLDGDSPNDDCLDGDVATALPAIRLLAEAVAILSSCGIDIEIITVDFSDAYRHCPVQRADWWEQCFMWHGGVVIEMRGVFGARWMPNRFQRLSRMALRVVQHEQRRFDRKHPIPSVEGDGGWIKRSHRDQERAFWMVYIDDTSGAGPSDPVPAPLLCDIADAVPGGPASPKDVNILEDGPKKIGATPAVGCPAGSETVSRACAWAKMAVFSYIWLGLPVSMSKTAVADKSEVLGAILGARDATIRPSAAKAFGICRDMDLLSNWQRSNRSSADEVFETMLGRLISLAVAVPDTRNALADLFRVKRIRTLAVEAARGDGRPPPRWHTSMAGSMGEAMARAAAFYRHALRECGRHASMPGAHPRAFRSPDPRSCILFCTDASGVMGEGYGGWLIVDTHLAKWMAGPETADRRTSEPVYTGDWGGGVRTVAVLIADVWPSYAQVAGKLLISSNTAEALARLSVACYLQGAPNVSHYIAGGDSRVVMGAASKGRSRASALDLIVSEDARRLQSMHGMSFHLLRHLNQRADDLSKRLAPRVAQELWKAGIPSVTLGAPKGLVEFLKRAIRDFPAK